MAKPIQIGLIAIVLFFSLVSYIYQLTQGNTDINFSILLILILLILYAVLKDIKIK